MQKISFILLLLAVCFSACKKETTPPVPVSYTFTGIVLHSKTRMPIPNAEVHIILKSSWDTSIAKYGINAMTYANSKGEYTRTVKDSVIGPQQYYGTMAYGKGLVQLRDSYPRSFINQQLPDTIWMDDASYVNIEVKINNTGSYILEWNFLKPSEPASISRDFYRGPILRGNAAGVSYYKVDSFASSEHSRIYMKLYTEDHLMNGPLLTEKILPLKSKDTVSNVKIEY